MKKKYRIILLIVSILILIGLGFYLYVQYSINQIGALFSAGIKSNLERPHNYIFHEFINRYPAIKDSTGFIPSNEIFMTFECYQRGNCNSLGKYSDNFIGLVTSDIKHLQISKGKLIDSVSFTINTPKTNKITGVAFIIGNKWKVHFDDVSFLTRLQTMLDSSSFHSINISSLTTFDWDSLCIFGPYSSPKQRFHDLNTKITRQIEQNDNLCLLVFTKNGNIVFTQLLSRNIGDFCYSHNIIKVCRENSTFSICKDKNGWRYLDQIKSEHIGR